MNTKLANLPIGVFDSGVGGLTVLKALMEQLPDESLLYLGDTARLPYGTKSAESVTKYALQCSRLLVDRGVKMLVVACNTASAVALPALREAYPGLPVVGVVRPGAAAACEATSNRRIAVIATESTVNGGAYQRAIRELCPKAHIRAVPSPLFVALAEEGWTSGQLVEDIAARYLGPLFQAFADNPPDTLVLGCTHFPVLARAIAAVCPPGTMVIDSADTTARHVQRLLKEQGLTASKQGKTDVRFMATDGAERFARVGAVFLEREISAKSIEIVDIL